MKFTRLKNLLVFLIFITSLFSCEQNEKSIDCFPFDCIVGDNVEFEFIQGNENILEQNPLTEIVIIQNNDTADFYIDIVKNTVRVFLYENPPLTILVGQIEFDVNIIFTFDEGECCSDMKVTQLSIDKIILCEDLSCDSVVTIEI